MGLEGLLSELLVTSVLDGVELESVRVGVDVMVLGEQVGHWVNSADNTQNHTDNNLRVGDLGLAEVGDVFSDIVGHLGCGGWSSIIVLDHTVVKLGRHSYDHVIVVGVEVTTLWHIKTKRR